MKNLLIIWLLGGLFTLFFTEPIVAQDKGNSQPVTGVNMKADNSRNSLDWAGVYAGQLPCADCEGIETVISLSKDLTFQLKTKYIGKNNSTFEVKGNFTWNKEGNKIELLGLKEGSAPVHYLVGEHKLIQLDREGNRITGQLAAKYVLVKEKSPITVTEVAANKDNKLVGPKWQLIELRGQPVVKGSGKRENSFLQFTNDGRFSAYAGCNRMLGGYDLKEGFRIRFKGMASTRMACPDMKTEQIFGEVLKIVDNYSLKGNRMTLNKARMAPLAVFELVQ